jgi:ferredoxin
LTKHAALIYHSYANDKSGCNKTYVITESCIACKYTDCVEVYLVDCFNERENMLLIHPDEVINFGVCEPECPSDAILPDTEPGLAQRPVPNAKFAASWPNISEKTDPLPDHAFMATLTP